MGLGWGRSLGWGRGFGWRKSLVWDSSIGAWVWQVRDQGGCNILGRFRSLGECKCLGMGGFLDRGMVWSRTLGWDISLGETGALEAK